MEWTRYSIKIKPEMEEAVSSLLYSLGIEGIQIEDGLPPSPEELGQMFVDLSPELAPDEWPEAPEAMLHFYLRIGEEEQGVQPQSGDITDDSYTIHDRLWKPEEAEDLLKELARAWPKVAGDYPLSIRTGQSREEEWRDNWKQYYQPIRAGKLLIQPCWEEVTPEDQTLIRQGVLKLIRLEPGTAFGSGAHESTRLCLDAMQQYIRGSEKVLDIGCGSGILGLAALALGAKEVTATELDPACEHTVAENLLLNDVDPARFSLTMGNILEDEKDRYGSGYDLIFCNILAPVVGALGAKGQADRLAAPGAVLISSGIYKDRQEEVEAAYRANPAWEEIEAIHLGDWVSLIFRKRQA